MMNNIQRLNNLLNIIKFYCGEIEKRPTSVDFEDDEDEPYYKVMSPNPDSSGGDMPEDE